MTVTLVNSGVQFNDGTTQVTSAISVKKLQSTDDNNTSNNHFMVITNMNQIKGWGYNGYGQLGDGYTYTRSQVIDCQFPSGFVGASEVHSQTNVNACCIDLNGKLWTWGRNDYGSAGTGGTNATGGVGVNNGGLWIPYCASNNTNNSIYGKTVVQIALPCGVEGIDTIVVRCSDGTVHGCGYNGYGQTGKTSQNGDRNYYFQNAGVTNCTWVACGRERYTAVAAVCGGLLYVWGYNGDNNLGQGGSDGSVHLPALRANGSLSGKTVVKSFGSRLTMYALCSDGTLHGWGNAADGQMGTGGTPNYSTPVQILTSVSDLRATGYEYTIIIATKTDGTIWMAGHPAYIAPLDVPQYDIYGALTGYGSHDTHYWTRLTGWSGTLKKVIWGGTGSYNWVTILNTAGVAFACGYNGNGQLGVGDNLNRTASSFAQVVMTDLIDDIAAYGTGSVGCTAFLTTTGKVYLTGYAGNYACGDIQGQNNWTPRLLQMN